MHTKTEAVAFDVATELAKLYPGTAAENFRGLVIVPLGNEMEATCGTVNGTWGVDIQHERGGSEWSKETEVPGDSEDVGAITLALAKVIGDWDAEYGPRFKCPECGGLDMDVAVSAWARVTSNSNDNVETDITNALNGDQEWDGDSHMQCRDCDHQGVVNDFERDQQEDEDEAKEAA